MNYTLKLQLNKICQETLLTWVQALPIALLRIRNQRRGTEKFSPCELLYGWPYQIPHIKWDVHGKGGADLNNNHISLGKTWPDL